MEIKQVQGSRAEREVPSGKQKMAVREMRWNENLKMK